MNFWGRVKKWITFKHKSFLRNNHVLDYVYGRLCPLDVIHGNVKFSEKRSPFFAHPAEGEPEFPIFRIIGVQMKTDANVQAQVDRLGMNRQILNMHTNKNALSINIFWARPFAS